MTLPGNRTRTRVHVIVLLGLLVAGLALAGICAGAVPLSPPQVLDALTGGPNGFVVLQYRLPRVAVAVLAGAALALSGLFLQAAVRNPLASPDVIGVTKGAGLGAMLVAVLVPPGAHLWATPVGVVAGAASVTALLLRFSRRAGAHGATLALAGIAIAALAAAAMQYLMVVFPQRADQAMVWLAGSVYGSTGADVAGLAVWLVVCLPGVVVCARLLDLAGLGDDSQSGLGWSPRGIRVLLVVVAVALAAGSVAAVGGIGFLGLLAPHLAARLAGRRARWLVPATALTGAVVLSLADLAGRLVALPNELPAGVVAAVVGGPYLLYILLREARVHA
ncbi:iron ABC transporter permease [Streptosporangium sp. NPDC002524]|uniref:FecCD family ABC transporter permease n=1 Tax=Streptosporangium sp. NPDC002524 TaxID=3154537 RepID=UPI003323BF6D